MAESPGSLTNADQFSPAAKIEVWLVVIISAVAISTHLHLVLVGWDASLMGFHSFRQAQTGLLIRQFVEDGVNWGSPLPIFGPPWYLPFEFPLYQATAAWVAQLFTLPVEQAARATSLGYLYVGLIAVYRILGEVPLRRMQRWPILALLLVTPTYLYYARSALIESCAWAMSWWFLWAFVIGMKTANPRWISLAMIAGILAGLVKITTFAAFLIPAGLYVLVRIAPSTAAAKPLWMADLRRAALMMVPGVLAAAIWVAIGDELKRSNDLAAVLVSSSLRGFSLGSLDLRLSSEFWGTMGTNLRVGLIHPLGIVLLIGLMLPFTRGKRLLVFLLLVAFLGGPLVFSNLYFVHDYYYYASGSFLLIAVGLTLQCIRASHLISLIGKYALWSVLLGLQIQGYATTHLPDQKAGGAPSPELARVLKHAINPKEIVLVFGQDWNPVLTYFSERDTIMVMFEKYEETDQINTVLDRLPPRQVTAMVATGGIRNYPDFFASYLARFDLYPEPVALSPDTSVYLSRSAVVRIFSTWPTLGLQDFTLVPRAPRPPTLPQNLFPLGASSSPAWPANFTPAPTSMMHPYEVTLFPMENETSIDAHPPTDIAVPVTPGALQIHFRFGIKPEAYAAESEGTDGVEFLIDYLPESGGEVPLHAILLDPKAKPAHRGPQEITFTVRADQAGHLRFQTRAGPALSPNYDWAYMLGWTITGTSDEGEDF